MEKYIVRVLEISRMADLNVDAEDADDAEKQVVTLLGEKQVKFEDTKIKYYVHPAKESEISETIKLEEKKDDSE